MDLFSHSSKEKMAKESPLAARMRPRTLDEYIGQDHILAEGRLLRRAIKADQLSSLIFYGPPGTGKTTLASVIANTTKSHFEILNAVLAGVKEIRQVIASAKDKWELYQRRTILFVDEVHRWNKSQQDALLPWVENGTVILIGATTENPYFSVNKALLSRSRVFQLKPLTEQNLRDVAKQAIKDERGFAKVNVNLDDDALEHLVKVANGDARAVLNALELAIETTDVDEEVRHITLEVAEESIQQRAVLYDQEGDYHFDTISAFIKSIRGSDPDAALYWMAKMIYAGEDPRYIFRRMLISSCEDIGLANPNAIQYVQSAADAFERVGMPEGNFFLANAAIYLATSPKSNSALAFFDALKTVREERDSDVPNHLRDASRDKEGFGHGVGYQYPHAFRDHWVAQQYLPDSLQGRVFYNPGRLGYEKEIAEDVNRRREEQLAAMLSGGVCEAPPEILTFSPVDKEFDRWIKRTLSQVSSQLRELRERVYEPLKVQRHFRTLVMNDDSGLLTWESLRLCPEGGTFSVAKNERIAEFMKGQCQAFNEDDSIALRMPSVLIDTGNLFDQFPKKLKFELFVARNILNSDSKGKLVKLLKLLADDAQISIVEAMPFYSSRLSSFIDCDLELLNKVQTAENDIYMKYQQKDEVVITAKKIFCENDKAELNYELCDSSRELVVKDNEINRWFDLSNPKSYASHLAEVLTGQEIDELKMIFIRQLRGKKITIKSKNLFFAINLSK